MQIGIRNVKFKPLNWEDVRDMHRICLVNCRYLRATINHLNAMVNGLTAKVDLPLRERYKKRVELAMAKLKEEEFWLVFYDKTLNKQSKKN